MTRGLVVVSLLLAACGDEAPPPAAGPPDAGAAEAPEIAGLPAASACTRDDECAGGTCLGAPGSSTDGNPRFTGGYCTSTGCTPDSQEGCGPEEWCTTAGDLAFCVEICSASVGLDCARPDQVCLGIGEFGGCFHQDRVECDSTLHTGCAAGEVCVRIGFDDDALGACETSCDPMAADPGCDPGLACYYVSRYDGALCVEQGQAGPDAECLCDRCCVAGYGCLEGRCRPYCLVSGGCASGGTCTPMEEGAPFGACVL